MACYPRLRDGSIVRWRATQYAQPEDVLAADPDGRKFAIGTGNARVLSLADGSRTTEEIAALLQLPSSLVLDLMHSFDELGIIFFEQHNTRSTRHKQQFRQTADLVAACRSAIWHITRKCNQGCTHCYYLKDANLRLGFSEREISSISKQLGILGVEVVTLTGGEVSIAKGSLELAAAALEDECIPFRINTNGTGNLDFFLRLIDKHSYLRTIQVSIDGLREHHDRMRDHAGAHAKVTAFAKGLAASRAKLRVVSMLTPEWSSPDAVRTMLSEVRDLSPSEWLIEVPSATGRWTTGLTVRESSRIARAAEAIIEDCLAHGSSMPVSLNQVFDWPPRSAASKKLTDTICAHDLGLLSFGPEGVSFCTLFLDSFGSEWKGFADPAEDLAQAWNVVSSARVKRKIGDNASCRTCELFSLCQGGCPGQYEHADEFSGCDLHSRTLALAKMSILEKYPFLATREM